MMTIRLRAVVEEHFGMSERTMYDKALQAKRAPKLQAGEAIMFASLSGNQIIWVLKPVFEDALVSIRSRKLRGEWSPDMIGEYAKEAGFRLEGLAGFEEIYTARLNRKAKG